MDMSEFWMHISFMSLGSKQLEMQRMVQTYMFPITLKINWRIGEGTSADESLWPKGQEIQDVQRITALFFFVWRSIALSRPLFLSILHVALFFTVLCHFFVFLKLCWTNSCMQIYFSSHYMQLTDFLFLTEIECETLSSWNQYLKVIHFPTRTKLTILRKKWHFNTAGIRLHWWDAGRDCKKI